MKRNKQLISLVILIGLLLLLPLLYNASQTVQQLLTRAAGTKANITINASLTLEPIQQPWRSFAQGGEESKDMIAPVISEIKQLSPRYIRIDHIYDHFDVVSVNTSGQLAYNFSNLDALVKSIVATGATPFFALSYMPQAIASSDITSTPKDWGQWQAVVQKTIEHYSGELNLKNVYYEVWNEPDLFGNWKYFGEKNYLTLYTYAARGAQNAKVNQEFKFGGPATTQLYKNWIVALANHVTNNNLRLDFFSWHRYALDPVQYKKDVADVTGWLFYYPGLVTKPRVISEWGFNPEVHAGYDGAFAAAHAVASSFNMLAGYDAVFAFEVVDGPDPAGNKFWGRWGLLTHPTKGVSRKPRFSAFQLLNQITGTQLLLKGEGTWVKALAATDNQTIKILFANVDPAGRNTESVPVTITNLVNGNYTLTTTRIGQAASPTTIEVMNGQLITEVILTPNAVTLLELKPQ